LKVLKRPIRDLHYRQSLMFFGSWNFAINLATPFFTVHMLQRLDLDLMTVILFAVISQTANILALPQWGRLIERYSSKAVLSVCAPAFLLCILAWTLTTFPDRYILTLPVLFMIHVVTGTATAGVAVASGNLAMKMAPRGGATAYLSANSLVNSLAAGVAPVIGGLLADFFLTRGFSVLFYWESPQAGIMIEAVRIQEWDFFFIFAAVLGLYSLHRLSTVHEEGSVKEGPVLAEFMQAARDGLRTLSTVAGLYAVTDFRFGFRRRKTKRRGSRPPHPPEPVVAPPPQG
ncbi:MAG: MFS transporter, partial [Rhodospirillales bacterium]